MTRRASKTTDEIRGRIEVVFYAGPKFSAGRLRCDSGEQITFAGALFARVGEQVVLRGDWTRHPKYGRQFKVDAIAYNLELDEAGLARYLANHPDIKGIGPVKARVIAAKFAGDFDRVLDERPEEIGRAAKLPMDVISNLRAIWQKNKAVSAAMTWLAAFGLTHHQVTTLVGNLGNNAVGLLKSNPYILIQEVKGFGFRRVDDIALKMGIPKEAETRIRSGLLFCVDEALASGDCWVEYEDLINRANRLLVMDCLDSRDRIEQVLRALLRDKHLDGVSFCSRFLAANPSILEMERELAGTFEKARRPNSRFSGAINLAEMIRGIGPSLYPGQRAAVETALSSTISVISGGAGSGKTFTVSTIVRICEQRGLDVVLCAPTGKAAKRLEQVVGRPASTIHRLLEYDGASFRRGPEAPLTAGVLVVDEVSMVDVPLAWHLFRALDLDRTAVVLVGDHNQLPPVGPGNILRDLIQTRVVPKVVLDTVVRQAGVLKENSTAILQGQVAKTSDPDPNEPKPWILVNQLRDPQEVQTFLLEMFDRVLEEKLGFDLVRDVQVLTPTHKGPLGTTELNILLQRLLQKKLWHVDVEIAKPGRRPRFYLHDKVIQTRNNYELDVMNGTVGFVSEVARDGALVIDFDDKRVSIAGNSPGKQDLQLAYALTIHRCQGSEFPCAVVIAHKSHSFMHHRNLFYTGVTRAQKTAIILGDRWGIRNCAEKQQVGSRKTFLSFLLAEMPVATATPPAPRAKPNPEDVRPA
jgi:exodeoxyribonuclease V alpha subunit